MNILVTGGAGFIGSHLSDALLARDHRVVVVDNLSLGTVDNIRHLLAHPRFSFVQEDLLNESALTAMFQKESLDMVFHLAANSDIAVSRENPQVDFRNTLQTTYAVLNQMRLHGVKKIAFASTSAVYGDAGSRLLAEATGPLFPVSHYGAAKLASEGFISSFVENYGMTGWVVRFPNVVGERSTHGIIFDFMKKLRHNPRELEVLGNGEQNKPFMYVKDLIAAIFSVWERTKNPMNLFNVGVASKTTVKQIAAMVAEEMELQPRLVYTGGSRGWVGDVPEFNYDLTKIHALGWRANYSSDEAVRLAIRKMLNKE
jgi:UDP-glucose 4-epimerase